MSEAIYECQNCCHTMPESETVPAKDIEQRHAPGDAYSDKECPKCGALCQQVRDEEHSHYVVWESGTVEKFDCKEDAEHEMLAMTSRGLRGQEFDDIHDVLMCLGHRMNEQILPVNLTGDARPVVRDFAGHFPDAWGVHVPGTNATATILRAKDSEDLFRLLIVDDDSKGRKMILQDMELTEIPEMIREELTEEAALKKALTKVADLIENCYAHDHNNQRCTPPRPTESMANALVEMEDEIFMALGRAKPGNTHV